MAPLPLYPSSTPSMHKSLPPPLRGALHARSPTARIDAPARHRAALRRVPIRVTSGGRQKHEERQQAVSLLGKDLARRARSRCELCDASGPKLFDTAPKAEPSLDTLLLLCERCTEMSARADGAFWRALDDRTVRFLEESVWSEIPAVRAQSLALLKRVGADWADDTVEMIQDLD